MKKISLITMIIMVLGLIFIIQCDVSTPVSCVSDEYTLTLADWTTGSTYEDTVCTVKESTYADFVMAVSDMSNLTQEQVDDYAGEFTSNIYPKVSSTFGGSSFNLTDDILYDTDSNDKVIIVLYDIVDGGGSIRGYVNNNDIIETTGDGNSGEYIYVDVANFNDTVIKSSLAHEFQHVVNQLIVDNIDGINGTLSEVWLDEALAMASEHLVYGSSVVNDRVEDFNSNPGVKDGKHGLVYWNDTEKVAANYALSYLFMQWVRYQAGSDSVYTDIVSNTTNVGNIAAVRDALGAADNEELLTGWAADNLTDTTYGGRLSTAIAPSFPYDMPTTIRPGVILYDDDGNDCSSGGCSDNGNVYVRGVNSDGTVESNPVNGDMSIVFNVNGDREGGDEPISGWVASGAEPPVGISEYKDTSSYNPRFVGNGN